VHGRQCVFCFMRFSGVNEKGLAGWQALFIPGDR